MHTIRLFIIAFILLTTANLSSAQKKEIKFNHISIENNLSQSSVTSILQDKEGFMWFGTLDGLNRYDGYAIKVFRNTPTSNESLAGNSISCLYEDRKGRLWIGTSNNGLCSYNKRNGKFKTYKSSKDKNSLINNRIRSISEDQSGNLWIGTRIGLSILNGFDSTFTNIAANEKNLGDAKINHIYQGILGQMYVACDDGVFLYDYKTAGFTNIAADNNNLYPANSLFQDKDSTLWIGTDAGLYSIKQNGAIKSYINNPFGDNEGFKVTAIIPNRLINSKDSSISCEGLWVGTEKGGLFEYQYPTSKNNIQKGENFVRHTHDASNKNSLSVDNILTLFQSKTGVLWVGTSLGGINKWDRSTAAIEIFRHNPYDIESLSSSQVRAIAQDRKGDVWIGTVDAGLNRWDKFSRQFERYNDKMKNEKLINQHVRAICEDSNNTLWIGTDGGGIYLLNKERNAYTKHYQHIKESNSISNDNIWKIMEDNEKKIWIATFGGGIDRYDPETDTFTNYNEKSGAISSNFITSIVEDKNHNLWFGTFDGGVNVLSADRKRWKVYKHNTNDSTSIGNNIIYTLFEDSEGTIWIGAKGSLNKLNAKTKTFRKFTVKDGFPNNVIMGILPDDRDNLWISTNGGISKFNKTNSTIRNYDVNDGLQSNEFLVGAYCKAADGEMLFGGINGLNAFFPHRIKDNPNRPKIAITGFNIFNNEIYFDTTTIFKKSITLSYRENVFSMDFVALNYIFPEKNRYAYKMENFDNDWQDAGNRRFATYTNLPHGDYVFRVKGSNNDGVWNNEGTFLNIKITPPFWRTKWFYILVATIIVGSIYSYIIIREKKLKDYNQKLEETVLERTAEILKQKQKIMDSIMYASRIQNAVLTPKEKVNEILNQHFILFKPRDIVSGDYYWMTQQKNIIVIVAADCTGHGVPGAFMSMLGIAFLNEIITQSLKDNKAPMPGEILEQLRAHVIKSLHQTGKDGETRDGMDLALCIIDMDTNDMYFSGAHNPVYVVRDKNKEMPLIEQINNNSSEKAKDSEPFTNEKYSLYEVKADKMPIGIHRRRSQRFTSHNIKLQKNDSIYIFSDGFVDQFGGTGGRKFLAKRFKELLISSQEKRMEEQKEILENALNKWVNSHGTKYEQVDDILVMGVKI